MKAPAPITLQSARHANVLDLMDDEERRVLTRIELFVVRGLDRIEARKVAVALIGRDRTAGQAVGSCVECQNYVLKECSVVWPVTEIHECWSRRHDAP